MYRTTSRFVQSRSQVRRRRRSAPGGLITARLSELGLGPTAGQMWVGAGGRAFTPQEAAEAVGVSPGRLLEWVVAFREEGPSGEAIRRALCGSGQGALSTSADVRPRLAPADGSAARSGKRMRPSKGQR
jgi:hypothetical protein